MLHPAGSRGLAGAMSARTPGALPAPLPVADSRAPAAAVGVGSAAAAAAAPMAPADAAAPAAAAAAAAAPLSPPAAGPLCGAASAAAAAGRVPPAAWGSGASAVLRLWTRRAFTAAAWHWRGLMSGPVAPAQQGALQEVVRDVWAATTGSTAVTRKELVGPLLLT